MENKHICFISPGVYSYLKPGEVKSGGGAERQQYLIGKKLREKGYEISYITKSKHKSSHQDIDGFYVRTDLPEVRGVTSAPFRIQKLAKAIGQVDADIYYIRGNPFLTIFTALICKLRSKPFIYAVANDSNVENKHLNEYNKLFKSAYVQAMKSASFVTVLRESQKKKLIENFGIQSEVIPCGFTLPDEDDLIKHHEREFILWVGTIDEDQKRPHIFLDLAKNLPNIEFILIGPNGPDNDYNKTIEQEGSKLENLQYMGFVRPDEIDWYFKNAIALVTTSAYEGFGNVLLEAWRYATPVVSLEYTMDENLKDKPIGLYSGSFNQLKSDVVRLHEETKLRNDLGENGRQFVFENYSLDNVVNKYEDVFDFVVRKE